MRKLKSILFALGMAVGLVVMSAAPALADVTAYLNPTANDSINGSVNIPGNAHASDNQYAGYDPNDDNSYRAFGLSIPPDATINGIEVQVEGYRLGSSSKYFDVALSYNGGTNWTTYKGTGDMGTTQDRTVTLGSPTDTWGYSSWTPAILNSATSFRVRLNGSTPVSNYLFLDNVRVRVTYTPVSSGPPTVVSAATNSAGTVISMTFNKPMASPAGKHGSFTYSINGNPWTVSAAALGATSSVIDLTVAGPTIVFSDTVVVSYTAGTVAAADGAFLATNSWAVTNNAAFYIITLNKVGSGTVTKTPDQAKYAPASSVNLTATPAAGWTFTGWSGSGLSGNATMVTLTMSSDKAVTATFTETPVLLTVNIVGSGYVVRNPDQASYLPSTAITVTLTPIAAPGASFIAWSGDLTGTTNPGTVLMNGTKTITATFTQNPVAVP
jgi:hypothetical protein